MAVKIRLARRGRKKLARYDVVVADARAPRDGRFIEKLGTYNPLTNPATIDLNDEKAFTWLMNGAQPTDTVKAMLSYRGVMMRKHLQIGVVKGALSQEDADKKLAEWMTSKQEKIQSKRDNLAKAKHDDVKVRKEAESKIKEARAEAIKKKAEVVAAAEVPAEEEVPVENVAPSEEVAAPTEGAASTEGEAPKAEGEAQA